MYFVEMKEEDNSFERLGRQDSEVEQFLSSQKAEESPPKSSKPYFEPKQYVEPEPNSSLAAVFDLAKVTTFFQQKKWIWLGAAGILLLILIWIFLTGGSSSANPQEVILPVSQVLTEPTTNETKELKAHIVGAVQNPGVYSFESGSRVQDLIKMAGGVSQGAYADFLNLASKLSDGQKICVPFKAPSKNAIEIEVSGCDTHQIDKSSSKILNINTASATDLESLPGIGPSLAQAIITYRDTQGDFESIDELASISGITSNLIAKFKEQVSV